MTAPTPPRITGVLERIVFFNEENHFCIGELRLQPDGQTITVTGPMPGVQCGETLDIEGEWTHHPVHGPQVKVKQCVAKLPSTVYGIRKYLGSGLIEGIGKVYANKIVDHFGADTLRIISEESKRLREIPGIGKQRATAIKQAWDEQQAVREVMMFLQTYGVTSGQCVKLVNRYGAQTQLILRSNPYQLASDIDGIGFKTADRIALNLGIPNESQARVDAGIIHAIEQLEEKGHTACPPEPLTRQAAELLQVDEALVTGRIEALVEGNQLIRHSQPALLQRPPHHTAESQIAASLLALQQTPATLPPIMEEKAAAWAQEKAGIAFAPEQEAALIAALKAKVSVITGGPGTGKTTLLKALCAILRAKKTRLMLAAPTGRAAQRMSEATGAPARTIHRLLQYDPATGGFVHGPHHALPVDFLIIDEASMLDDRLAAVMLRALPAGASLLLVGDVDQLPSVGPGNVLQDIIQSGRFPVTTLQRVFRQGDRSSIVGVAHAILAGEGRPPLIQDSPGACDPSEDFHFIEMPGPEAALACVGELCREWLPQWYQINPISQVQVLAPLHKGIAGIGNLNRELQALLNPRAAGINYGGSRLQVGDKVIQTRNNYDKGIFNGDLGLITAVDPGGGGITVDFDGQTVELERGDLSQLQLAYAISIHKSQGSEFPVVVMPLLKQHFVMLQRNLIYTGLTRGKRKVFIVGESAAYGMAVRNQESTRRITYLLEQLRAGV